MKRNKEEYLQSAMFGFNDALVSTTGVMVGVGTGTTNKEVVILAGIVTIVVEALSMGSGEYLSSKSAHQLEKTNSFRQPIINGLVMFSAYFMAGLVPLFAFILSPERYGTIIAVSLVLLCLLVLGYVKGRIVKVSPLRSALEVFIIGGITTAIGVVAGKMFAV